MNVKKCKLLPCLFIGFGLQVSAQQAMVASGGDLSGSSSFSVGQVVYTTQSGTTGSNALGVQQPIEVSEVLAVDTFTPEDLGIKVYPNPISSYVNLEVRNYAPEKLSYELYDLNGRIIRSENLRESITKIDMEILPSTVYLLIVKKGDSPIRNFRLIKKD